MKFINSQNVWCLLYLFLWPTRRETPVCCFTSWLLSILFLWLSCTLIQINSTVTLPSVVEFTAEAHKSVVCSLRKALVYSTVIPTQWIIKTIVQLWFQSVPVSPPLCLCFLFLDLLESPCRSVISFHYLWLQVRFVRNVTSWREMKPGFYHGHVAYLDFSK